jgi:hypothetical protein
LEASNVYEAHVPPPLIGTSGAFFHESFWNAGTDP